MKTTFKVIAWSILIGLFGVAFFCALTVLAGVLAAPKNSADRDPAGLVVGSNLGARAFCICPARRATAAT